MALSFACPMCQARMEVGDELAGRTGQCPRCRHVFVVPGPIASPATAAVPPTNPWTTEPTQPASAAASPRNGSRRRWLIAALLTLVVTPLLLSGFIKLMGARKPTAVNRNRGSLPDSIDHVTSGQLKGGRAFLDKGVFQIHSELTHNDPLLKSVHCKRYEIELIAKRVYVIEHDSPIFDTAIHVFDQNDEVAWRGNLGVHKAALIYTPPRTGIYTIYAAWRATGIRPVHVHCAARGEPGSAVIQRRLAPPS